MDQGVSHPNAVRQTELQQERETVRLQSDQVAFEWERLRLERQKLALELRFRRRELLGNKNKNTFRDIITNPVTVAIVGGILTLMTTIVTNLYNATANREAEAFRARLARESAEQTLQADLIKKFVESPKTETVRENLRFLIDAGLLPNYSVGIQNYLNTSPGAPQIGAAGNFVGGVVGLDDRVALDQIAPEVKANFQGIGKIFIRAPNGDSVCSGFIGASSIIITLKRCLTGDLAASGDIDPAQEVSFEPWSPPNSLDARKILSIDTAKATIINISSDPSASIAIVPLRSAEPALPNLSFGEKSPVEGQPLTLGFFAFDRDTWVSSGGADCKIILVEKQEIRHLCDTGAGSSGAPIFDSSWKVVGIHLATGEGSKRAVRIDSILKDSAARKALGKKG